MESPNPCPCATERLREIMLHYLYGTRVCAWPGCDGLTVEAVLDSYPEAVATGIVCPDWQELFGQYPHLGEELYTWLAGKDRWQFAFRGRSTTTQHEA
jgi:hypothetical protein